MSISTTWVFNAFICHFFSVYLHKGLQPCFSHSWSKPTLSMWLEPFQHMRVLFMASSHFHIWFNNDLILHIVWLLIAWVVRWLNPSIVFFTTTLVHQRLSPCLSFTLAWSSKALFLLFSPYQAILKSYYILNQHLKFIWIPFLLITYIDIYESTTIWSSQFMIPYIIFILASHTSLSIYLNIYLQYHNPCLNILNYINLEIIQASWLLLNNVNAIMNILDIL
jgi:hypothetical protein